jgi:uncharacterized protein YndB with AHSA1/START domain
MSKPEFVYVTYIETTPEKLWEALTDSAFSKRYWFGTEVRSDWTVGSAFALVTDGNTSDTGTILEADRPRRLCYTFKHELYEAMREPATKVAFTIEPYGDLVKLTVTHEDFIEGSKLVDAISNGWPAILSSLKSLLETGKPLAISRAALGKEELTRS